MMNNIINTDSLILFLDYWQTLIGAALGTFFAVVFSVIGFWIKSIVESLKERKEKLRRIEIGITRSLNDIYTLQEQLRQFVKILKNLALEARGITNKNQFFLSRVNFPTAREIYRDIDAPTFKVKSYYLHNKILFVNASTKQLNETVRDLKDGFESLIKQNELLVTLMSRRLPSDSPNSASDQQKAYADHLEDFAEAISDYASQYIQEGIKTMTQIKIYNNHLRKKRGYERIHFKYFKNRAEISKYLASFDSLDRIDNLIKKEVDYSIENPGKDSI